MVLNKIKAFIFVLLISTIAGKAQLIKSISSVDVPDNYTVRLEGDKNTTLTFRWTSADLKKPNVIYSYAFQLDTVGGAFDNPWSKTGGVCCASFFNDTIMNVSLDYLAKEIDYIYTTRYKKNFVQGDSVVLDWIIAVNASGPGASYDNKKTLNRTITFIRGQFNQEYVPVKLLQPLDNSSFFVEDNATINLKFQWNKAYCPTGCDAAQYQIMFDSMGGDFSNPLYFFTVPQSPFDTLLDVRQDVLAQMMFDDGVPRNTPKTYKWTVKTFGNGEEFFAIAPRRISLLRGLMRTENIPFYIQTPVDNAVFKLEDNKNDSIVFRWNKTQTGFPDAASYILLFDTAQTTPNFNNPKFRFKTSVGDTSFISRYIALRDSIDKNYGKKWNSVSLKWTVQADIIGYKFMSEDTNDMLIARGFFAGIQNTQKQIARIYPNPATQHINIITDNGFDATTVQVCDALGRILFTSNVAQNNGHINCDVSNLAAGLYYVRLWGQNGWARPITFVKQQ